MTSPFIRFALDRISELRQAHRAYIEADYAEAVEATNGKLLNERGREKGVDSYDLFTHNRTFFSAYASEELVEWRAAHPRMTFESYEHQMFDLDDVDF